MEIDLLLHNTTIYTVDQDFSTCEAIGIHEGKVVATGTNEELLSQLDAKESINLEGKFVYPGFYDAHCHLISYAPMLEQVKLADASSWEEVLERVKLHRQQYPEQEAIVGIGWNQTKWDDKSMPNGKLLTQLFPDIPILLVRIDYHAAVANQKALAKAGVHAKSIIPGGEVVVEQGEATGLLLETAIAAVWHTFPSPSKEKWWDLFKQAEQDCFRYGLTTLGEAKIGQYHINIIDDMHRNGALKMRFNCMVHTDDAERDIFFQQGPIYKERLRVHTMKYFADGALGSRGAWLLTPYSDDPSTCGIAIHQKEDLLAQARLCDKYGFQMATHAIGDAANKQMLDIYEAVLQGKNDKRWRIEHAQILDPTDLNRFGNNSITPSIQATHATSDMYWVKDRLGEARTKNAYRFQSLLQQNGFVAAGSDFPIESVNPILGFYAAIARRDVQGYPEERFQPEEGLTRKQAMQAMTSWAAYANFEEKERGSLEVGKVADLVVLDRDLMQVAEELVTQTEVLATYVGGEKVIG